jgi:hypothetical protein
MSAFLTRLEIGVKGIREDLDKHTTDEEKHFEDFRTRNHALSGEINAIGNRVTAVEARLGNRTQQTT